MGEIPDPTFGDLTHPLGEPGFWKMRDGRIVPIEAMSQSHRRNAIAMIERFIEHEEAKCIDPEGGTNGEGKVVDPLGLLSLNPWKEKKGELEDSLP